jgi:hypothetical protein
MVRKSRRKALINALTTSIKGDLKAAQLEALINEDTDLSSENTSDSDDKRDELEDKEMKSSIAKIKMLKLLYIQSKRYLGPCSRIEKAPVIGNYLLNVLEEKRFKQHFCMSQASFFKLCEQVSRDPVFHNESHCSQHPLVDQMMVALKRVGCDGNGVAIGQLATFFRIGEGTVELYTDRCIMAILGLKANLLIWPSPAARKEIQSGFAKVGFDGCVGLLDGTLVVLATCPQKDGLDYYNRKGSYGIVTLLICNQEKNILYSYHHDQSIITCLQVTYQSTNAPLYFEMSLAIL